MSRQLIGEWSQSLRRLAQEKVAKREQATIVNALRTWNEFEEHVALRDRDLPPDAVDADTFLHGGTQAPVRALNAFRWLNNQGRLGWPLDRVTAPEPNDKTQKKHQKAIVLEPPMLAQPQKRGFATQPGCRCWGLGW